MAAAFLAALGCALGRAPARAGDRRRRRWRRGGQAGGAGSAGSPGAAGAAAGVIGTAGGGAGATAGAAAGTGASLDASSDASADASSGAAGADGGDAPSAETPSATCATSGTELCNGSESGSVDAKVWGTHTTGSASVAVDEEHVHGGTYALHVKLAAGAQQTAQLTDAVTFPAKDNTFYTRAWFYFSPDLPADNMGGFHMAFLLATGNNNLGFVEAGLGSAGDKQYLGYSEYYGAGPDVHAHGPTFTEFGPRSSVRVAPATWICLELMQGGDATRPRTAACG